ncbi:hypothetical protein [Nocardioides daejeonensis]|uniref:hypothetical protein n=1 Tax=Nocardioides daejeonensis TaxID=1046556 RepID=UPI000D74A9E1|nr:hypothetical protein [Nocardioides daejeonensis]
MTRERGALAGAVRVLAVFAVLCTLGAGIGAAVVQAQEESPAAAQADGPTPAPNPSDDVFAEPPGGFSYRNWVIQRGDDATYRVPGGWQVTGGDYEATDADGAVVARGADVARYYGNACTEETMPVAAGWTVLAEAVAGDDAAVEATRAVVAWARSFASNEAGTTAPVSDPVTTENVTLADGSQGARSVVMVDWSVFTGPCYPETVEVAVTTTEHDGELVSLVQARYLLASGGVTNTEWAAIAASLTVG